MKAWKKVLSAAITGIMVLALAGCSSVKFEPTESSIFVKKDKTVVSAEMVSVDNSEFDTPRYDENEMKTFLETAVKEYNKEACGQDFAYAKDTKEALNISIEEFKVENKVAAARLNYASSEDYLKFNGTEDSGSVKDLIIGTVADGISSGLDFSGMVNADGSAAGVEEIQKNTKYSLVAITGPARMMVEGKVRYMSSGVTLADESTVVTSGDETVYIIFK
ncbi:hypothetical protein MUB23_12615 [Cuneatibacter sp. NSJ-177]|uniref:hypothetical protein n=1 Tax=Cuneatibacter sp. NSJ-177 TaxID=2931401 RepID=UPI001FD18C43|nr:hypothetical protein [Cuneatibacter sp. NSJ-177]MCJ7836227.1 hypothetical protein [Cuneatibacter sp. NSJ-177]